MVPRPKLKPRGYPASGYPAGDNFTRGRFVRQNLAGSQRMADAPIISPELAYLITNVLSDETARWPSLGHPNPLEIGRPVAAKIGRTGDNTSNWVIGYTPDQLIGVWLGQSESPAGQSVEGRDILPQAAAGLWHAITQYAHQDQPSQNWPVPPGVTTQKVCDPSGMLPTNDCPIIVEEVFLAGNEPIQADRLYRTAPVNRKSGRLATIYTPLDLVDHRPYLMVPPEAAEWAQQEGYDSRRASTIRCRPTWHTSPKHISPHRKHLPSCVGRRRSAAPLRWKTWISSACRPDRA